MPKHFQAVLIALLTLILRPETASGADNAKPSPFVVQGKIVDVTGKPLEGVQVNANCGDGSLFQTGSAKTDTAGKYRLTFSAGAAVGGTKLGVGTQVATISPRLNGWYEIHLGRRGNLLMSDMKNQLKLEDTKGYAGVVGANEPYTLDFSMARSATIRGRFVNEFGTPLKGLEVQLTGEILPPSCGILAAARTDEEGRFTFDNVPVWLADPSIQLKWRFLVRLLGVRHEIESSTFEVSAEAVSVQNLTLNSDGDRREVRLTLTRRTGESAGRRK